MDLQVIGVTSKIKLFKKYNYDLDYLKKIKQLVRILLTKIKKLENKGINEIILTNAFYQVIKKFHYKLNDHVLSIKEKKVLGQYQFYINTLCIAYHFVIYHYYYLLNTYKNVIYLLDFI